jgi:high-affinity iron transporter
MHERRKRAIMDAAPGGGGVFWGLVLLGLTAVYREGFEVVLFLQSIRLRAGQDLVLKGTGIGLGLTAIVAVLTFIAHRKLPYRKMLIATGVMLGAVLLVMVGESAQELQQAGWISTTKVGLDLPDWMGTWFAVFPNVEGLAAQAGAAVLVVGSYLIASRRRGGGSKPSGSVVAVRVLARPSSAA